MSRPIIKLIREENRRTMVMRNDDFAFGGVDLSSFLNNNI
jgi:hypothetical protein